MLTWLDDFLNNITMYRLVLYVLMAFLLAAIIFGAVGILPYSPLSILFSTGIIFIVCYITNKLFAWAFNTPTNTESFFITALILALIITPPKTGGYINILPFLFWVSVWAMAGKFIFAFGKKHLFNPAALAVAITAFTIGHSASWWIGTGSMLPLVVVGGLLITRKIQRFDLVITFFIISLSTIIVSSLSHRTVFESMEKALSDAPLLFFAFIMLTEPATTPPTRKLRILYGILVGVLFAPNMHIKSLYSTPELALLVGNIFSYLVSPKQKYALKLKEKLEVAKNMYEFVFTANKTLKFRPGQYLEWTLAHKKTDSRGNRRYFTISSAPTETEVRLGIKFYGQPSSFKKALLNMSTGQEIFAGQLAGDFTLPDNTNKKLAFIAGGIGITPFRSMVKQLLNTKEKRSVALFYSNKTASEIMYTDIFNEASTQLGIKTIYTLTDETQIPQHWQGHKGYITTELIKNELPDFKERMFYLSGPHTMVVAFEKTLKDMGISGTHIKIDFFPGLV